MIVFLHGYTGSAASWDVVRARLSPSTPSRCEALLGHAPELVLDGSARGHSFAGEVERLAKRLRSDGPVHLVGYSLGARLALAIAVAHPDRVGRLTLLSVHPGLRSPVERTARTVEDEGWARLLEEQGLPGFLAAWDARPLFASRARLPFEVLAPALARRQAHDPRGLALALRTLGLGRMPSLTEACASLRTPVTLMAGALDDKFCTLALRLSEVLPRARTITVPAVGHDLVLEAARAVAHALEEDAP